MIGFLKLLSRNRLSLAGLVVITVVIFVALLTPLLPLTDPDVIAVSYTHLTLPTKRIV